MALFETSSRDFDVIFFKAKGYAHALQAADFLSLKNKGRYKMLKTVWELSVTKGKFVSTDFKNGELDDELIQRTLAHARFSNCLAFLFPEYCR